MTRKICINAMGIALFVVFTLCIQVPVFENYYLCLGYIAMALYTYYWGTFSGTLVGMIGVVIYCFITSGMRGMPGWALGNLVIGILCGLACRLVRSQKTKWMRMAILSLAVLISTAIGILVVKSMTEVVLYSLPFMVRVATNSYAFVADVVVLIIGFFISVQYEPVFRRILK